MRLVARAYERTVTRKAAKIARTYAVLTSTTLAALELAAMHFHAAVDATYLEKLFTVFLLSLFTSVPLVPLFVALSLLAADGDEITEPEALSVRNT